MPSPHPSALPSSHGGTPGGAERHPPLMKRHSSQQSHGSNQGKNPMSPSSAGEGHQPLRHHVKPVRKTKIVVPRNNSSARNLAKLAKQAPDGHVTYAEPRKPPRQKSHERDTQIRLPGSLEENRPAMRRNLTSQNLPRNASHTKLKKNLSHGQLARLGSGRNLQALGSKGPPSPGLKGKNKGRRHRSADMGEIEQEKDLHEQEVELARKQEEAKQGPKKVGFAVGSVNDSSDEEGGLGMDGSGMQEDEWTDQSASASPNTTRQNTANNSRRPSMSAEKPPEKSPLRGAISVSDINKLQEARAAEQRPAAEADGTPAASFESSSDVEGDDEEGEADSPPSIAQPPKVQESIRPSQPSESPPVQPQQLPPQANNTRLSSTTPGKDHPNPFTKQLLNRNNQTSAPALVSNISTLDVSHSARGSPAASLRSSQSNMAENNQLPDQEDELVSRFLPSASHPSTTGSAGNTNALNTPRTGSYQTPEHNALAARNDRHRDTPSTTTTSHSRQPTSPGSTISAGSSGATTPAIARSRTELRMQNERAIAALDSAAAAKPHLLIPAHRFDRRNESLKSYLNVVNAAGNNRLGGDLPGGPRFGPEIFEGRFKAVNTELKVVQRFRDPVAESVTRLKSRKTGLLGRSHRNSLEKQPPAGSNMKVSQSAVALNKRASGTGSMNGSMSKLATSASPPKGAAMASSRSSAQLSRENEMRRSGGGSGRVKFSQTPPTATATAREAVRPVSRGEDLSGADAVARRLWDVGSGSRGER